MRERYDRLWSAAVARIRLGQVEIDSVLAAGAADRRRGLTVIARPPPAIQRRVAEFLDHLRHLEPDQHYYAPTEFHLTILSLFTATPHPQPFFAQAPQYLAAVEAALARARPIPLVFTGITASPGSVMIQGFPAADTLNKLRDALREELLDRGLAQGLDERYRLETAHMTVARFRAPLRDPGRLAAALTQARRRPFGAMTIGPVSLVSNDWYMTRGVVKTIRRYRLAAKSVG